MKNIPILLAKNFQFKKIIKITFLFILAVLIFVGCKYVYQNPLKTLIKYYKITKNYDSLSKIDKIYIVNLDQTPQRYERMKVLLESMNLPIEYIRFSAIDGKKAQITNSFTKEVIMGSELISNKNPLNGEFNIKCSDNFSGGFEPLYLTSAPTLLPVRFNATQEFMRAAGVIGCSCSHRKLWQEIIQKGYKNVLIFEDDLNFIDHFKERLAIIMNNLPDDYELIYLGWFSDKDVYDDNFQSLFLNKVSKHIGSTEAYIVSQAGAKKLFDGTNLYNAPIDIAMSNLIENNKINAYATKPNFTSQAGSIKSIIEEDVLQSSPAGYFRHY